MHELVLRVDEALVEPVSDALGDELGALAVSVEDADAGGAAEHALFGEPGLPPARGAWQHSTVRALFDDDAAATGAATLLLAQDWAADVHVQSLHAVPDQDWVRVTQSQFLPIEIAPTFWIVPSWHEAPAAATRVLRLDPGMAFGTGTHPTTRMCLRWIARHVDATTRRTLDYGCGSGILAVSAALFGAHEVDAVDIDPAAVQATRDNAGANRVALRVGAPELVQGRYDLVLANILAKPLVLLAPLLSAHLAPAAPLVLAGLLERQVDELQRAYAPWVRLAVADREDGWVLLTGCAGAGA